MAREHDWTFGLCRRCGWCTDLAGGDIEDAPPCDLTDSDVEEFLDKVAGILGVDTGMWNQERVDDAVGQVTKLLSELSEISNE